MPGGAEAEDTVEEFGIEQDLDYPEGVVFDFKLPPEAELDARVSGRHYREEEIRD